MRAHMLLEAREGSVDPDYSQFYLKTATGAHAADMVTEPGYEAHLEAPNTGFVYVGTLKKFFKTPVRVEVHDAEPSEPPDEWQHVAEVSFIGDGRLDVLSWPGDTAFSIPTPAGPLRLRAMWGGLEPGLSEGLPETGESMEHLLFQIWPGPAGKLRVLRWWPEWVLPPPEASAPDERRQVEGTDEVTAFVSANHLRMLLADFNWRTAPSLPGGSSGRCIGIWGNPEDGTWWVDGYDVRRTLRPASDHEIRELLPYTVRPSVWEGSMPQPSDQRWESMLERIGFNATPGSET